MFDFGKCGNRAAKLAGTFFERSGEHIARHDLTLGEDHECVIPETMRC